MNQVFLVGRLTKDIELKEYGKMGAKMTSFSLALDRGKDKNGQDMGCDFPVIKAFNKTAENLAKYCGKGGQIAVIGRIHTDSYEKDGNKVYTTDVTADKIEFLSTKKKEEEKVEEKQEVIEGFAMISEDDIPF